MCFFLENTKREYRGETSWSILVEMLGDLLADDGHIGSRQELVEEFQVSAQAGDFLAAERSRFVSAEDVVDLTEDVEETVTDDGPHVGSAAQTNASSAAEREGVAGGGACSVGEGLGDASEVRPVRRRRRADVDETEQMPVRCSARIAGRTSQPERSTGADAAPVPPTKRRRR